MYEYLIQAVPKGLLLEEIEGWFNIRGKDGWELCGRDWGCCIFKRLIK
jgi:hypothetical protein